MLEGLDDIAWDSLSNAYGDAHEIPSLLTAIAGGDVKAVDLLEDRVWHQSTIYETTLATAPFLVRLVELKSVRVPIAKLLHRLMLGTSFIASHRHLPNWQTIGSPEEEELLLEQELADNAKTKQAIRAGLPAFCQFLEHGSDEERACFGVLVGLCGDEHSLSAQLKRESVSLVRATIALELAASGTLDARVSLAESLEASSDPLDRFCVGLVGLDLSVGEPSVDDLDRVLGLVTASERVDLPQRVASRGPLRFALEWLEDNRPAYYALASRAQSLGGAAWAEVLSLAPHIIRDRRDSASLRPVLLEALETGEPKEQEAALSALALFGKTATLPKGLERFLDSPVWSDRYTAALRLLVSHEHPSAVPELAARLDEAIATRHMPRQLMELLELIGSWAPGLSSRLLQLLDLELTQDPLGPQLPHPLAKAALQYEEVLCDSSALEKLKRRFPGYVLDALKTYSEVTKRELAAHIQFLDAQHDDPNPRKRVKALQADPRLSDAKQARVCVELLRDGSSDPVPLLKLLGELERWSTEAVAMVETFVGDEDERVSTRAAVTYGRLTGDGERLAPVFARLLEEGPVDSTIADEVLRYSPAAMSRLEPVLEKQAKQLARGYVRHLDCVEPDASNYAAVLRALAHVRG